jgi:hypothetical protein
MKKSKSKSNQSEDIWIDIHNDDVMRENGLIRPRLQEPRDMSVWSRTLQERVTLRKFKRHGHSHFHTSPAKFIPVYGKLIITLKKNNKFANTVYSVKCHQHSIPDIISRYCVKNKNGDYINVVSKYYWNGKTYSPREVPFWQ